MPLTTYLLRQTISFPQSHFQRPRRVYSCLPHMTEEGSRPSPFTYVSMLYLSPGFGSIFLAISQPSVSATSASASSFLRMFSRKAIAAPCLSYR